MPKVAKLSGFNVTQQFAFRSSHLVYLFSGHHFLEECGNTTTDNHFGGDPDHDTDPGVFKKELLQSQNKAAFAAIQRILLITQEVVDEFL